MCVASLALYKTSHPHFMTSNHRFYDITPTIFDIISTVSVSSHPLYWWYHINCIFEITFTIIHRIISIVYDMTVSLSVSSHPLVWWYHNLCVYDIKATICTTSYTLYKWSHPYFMILHPIIYDITCTVFMTSLPLYLTLHPLYLCQDQCISYATLTLCMTSHTPYVWHRLHYTRYHILTLGPKTTVFMSSHPLYLTSCPLYLCHHIHCIDDITSTVFLRSHSL